MSIWVYLAPCLTLSIHSLFSLYIPFWDKLHLFLASSNIHTHSTYCAHMYTRTHMQVLHMYTCIHTSNKVVSWEGSGKGYLTVKQVLKPLPTWTPFWFGIPGLENIYPQSLSLLLVLVLYTGPTRSHCLIKLGMTQSPSCLPPCHV